jgi:pimeloyl-ACP methyl ester carboxylesterase
MASKKHIRTFSDARVRGLREAMGVRSPHGWLTVEDGEVAWEEIRSNPAELHPDRQGQPVICLHDAGNGSREFRLLAQHCPTGARLILLDWPGHGRSRNIARARETANAPTDSPTDSNDLQLTLERCTRVVHSVVNQLGLRRPILLGSGFGAAVAIQFAAEHPRRVLGLVLCQPAGLFPEVWKRRGAVSAGWSLLARRFGRWRQKTPLTPTQRQSHRVGLMGPAVLWEVIAEAASSLQGSVTSLRAALETLPCPVLFAFSRDSRAFPLKKYLALLDPLLKTAPQHRFTVFTGRYSPLWDEPARFAQALCGFVQAQLPLQEHQHAWLLTAVDWPARGVNLWKCVHPECREEHVLPAGEDANAVELES